MTRTESPPSEPSPPAALGGPPPDRPISLRNRWRAWLREPLLHFIVLGGLLFWVHARWGQSRNEAQIIVTAGLLADIQAELEQRLGRAPTRAESADALETWKRTEVWYREGLKRGLDRDDPEVRARVAGKTFEIEQRGWFAPKPTDADLDNWLSAHRSLYEVPLRLSIQHWFVSREHADALERARRLLQELDRSPAAKEPTVTPDPHPAPGELRAQRLDQLEALFGPEFAREVSTLSHNGARLIETKAGFHVVKLLERDGGLPTRDQIRPRLEADWKAQRALDFRIQKTRELMGRYAFIDAPEAPSR